MVRYNVAPQAHAAACVVLHLAEVLRVEQRCNVIRNLVEHAHDLIGREIRALFVCNAYERVDVGQHARLITHTMERELTRLDRLFQLGLGVARVNVVLAGVGRVGQRTVDRARGFRAGRPVDSRGIIRCTDQTVLDGNHALIVRRRIVMQHALELHALLVAQAARPVREQTLDRAVLRITADCIEAVRLDLVEERLVSCILHRAGRAAGEQQACVLGQRLAALPVQIVVVGKVGNRLNCLLRVHKGRADVGRNVVDLVRRCREALVLLNHDLQFVADLARILRLCVLAGCLCTAAVQTEQVQRLGICEDLAQRTQLVRRVGVAGQRK